MRTRDTGRGDAQRAWGRNQAWHIAWVGLGLIVSGTAFAQQDADAQGPLRRLGDRIRERVDPIPPPPLGPAVPPAAGAPGVDPRLGPDPQGRQPLLPWRRPPATPDPQANRPNPGAANPSGANPNAARGNAGAGGRGAGGASGMTRLSPIEPGAAGPRASYGDSSAELGVGGAGATANAESPTIGIDVIESRDGVPGVQIRSFLPFSLAEHAGLRPGDLIIAIDGQPTPTIASVATQLTLYQVGEMIEVRIVPDAVFRGGPDSRFTTREVMVPLVSRSGAAGAGADRLQPGGDNPLGGENRMASPSGRAKMGMIVVDAVGQQGAVVKDVQPNSPAAVVRLEPGDRIVSIDGRVVTGADSVIRTVGMLLPGDSLRLQWVRNDQLLEAEIVLAGPDGIARNGSGEAIDASGGIAAGAGAESMPATGSGTPPTDPSAPGGALFGGLGSAIGGFFGGNGPTAPPVNRPAVSPGKPDNGAETLPPPRPQPELRVPADPVADESNVDGVEEKTPADETSGGELPPQSLPSPSLPPPGSDARLDGPASGIDGNEVDASPFVADPLAFGDNEPVMAAGFQTEQSPSVGDFTTKREAGPTMLQREADPPSLQAIELPTPRLEVAEDETVSQLRAEIERLRARVLELEAQLAE